MNDDRPRTPGFHPAQLDTLQTAVWGKAVQGNMAAVDQVLKVMAARAQLLGLSDDPAGQA